MFKFLTLRYSTSSRKKVLGRGELQAFIIFKYLVLLYIYISFKVT
jgi:hypothetical protein